MHLEETDPRKPWQKSAPEKKERTILTPASIAKAKAAAQKAGRPYPNLIDNMKAAREQKAQEMAKTKPQAKANARRKPGD